MIATRITTISGQLLIVENLADVRVVQCRNSSGFLLETLAVLLLDLLDGHNASQAGVPRFPHLAHATGADGFNDFVWAEFFSDHGKMSPENTGHSMLD